MAEQEGQYTHQKFGNYRLGKLLGIGGFAEVYLAEHIYLGTQAAVKVLTVKLTEDEIKRFRNEAKMLIDLEHPNIAKVRDFGVENGIPYIVMHYTPNGTLRKQHPHGSRVPLPVVINYVKQVAAALQHIHDEHQLIHRDIKPENMLVGKKNEILLSDFGVAIVTHSTRSRSLQQALGTAVYMAPEHFQAKAELASDQYSLAIVVYEWLTGEPPFQGDILQLAYQQGYVAPPSLRDKVPDLPIKVEEVVMKALAKDPKLRFVNVEDFAKELEEASTKPAVGTLLCTYKMEWGEVYPISWSPDSKLIAFGTTFGSEMVYIWNPSTGKEIFACHQDYGYVEIVDILWLSDSSFLYSWRFTDSYFGDHDFIRGYNIITKQEIFNFKLPFAFSLNILFPNKKSFAFIDYEGNVQIRSFNKEEIAKHFNTDEMIFGSLSTYISWSPAGIWLALLYRNGLKIIDVSTKPTHTIKNFEGVKGFKSFNKPIELAWSPDSKAIAFIDYDDRSLQVWDIPSTRLLTYQLDGKRVRGRLLWSTHGLRIAFIDQNEHIQILDVSSNTILGQCNTSASSIIWSPDGTRIASASEDGTVHVWQAV